MIVPFLDLKLQYQSIQADIDQAIASVFESGVFIGGKAVTDFEKAFEMLCEVDECIGVGNGTDALYVILKCLGIGTGDEVITPALSWISTAETISHSGARPVFADVDPNFYTLSVKTIESKITAKTKAILLVHLFGQAAPVREIRDFCRDKGLMLVEDCSQAHLTEEHGTYVGKFGHASAFSLYPSKNLGAYGDAGCVITSDPDLARKMRRFANHGGLTKDEHLFEGINSRLDPIQAAVLSIKLQHIQKWTEERVKHASRYSSALQGCREITTPQVRQGSRHSFHLYAIRTKKRDLLKEFLAQNQIQTIIHYPRALPFEPAYHHFKHQPRDFPVSQVLSQELLSLPVFPELSIVQQDFVIEKALAFYRNEGK